ncbi:5278_t:CDS:2, partial [Entrophospora sp. SA101]
SYGAMVNDDGFSWNFLFERITKVTVPVLFNDRDKFRFVVDIQICINSLSQIKPQETAGKIEQLRLDHSYNKFNPSSKDLTDLIPFKLHIPQKTKTKKVETKTLLKLIFEIKSHYKLESLDSQITVFVVNKKLNSNGKGLKAMY